MIQNFDERRDIIVPGDEKATIQFCVQHFIDLAIQAIADRGLFFVALSGGSTPKQIYKELASEHYRKAIDWSKVVLFWSDERSVPPENSESNFHMAMEAGLKDLPLDPKNIHRMKAETEIEEHAKEYEQLLKAKIPSHQFDLVMLGMGEDGHTASLFPKTHALHAPNRKVVANYVPEKNTWRMTLTYECIHEARHSVIYVIGKSKAETVKKIFTAPYNPDLYPIQKIGIPKNRVLWVLDQGAAEQLASL